MTRTCGRTFVWLWKILLQPRSRYRLVGLGLSDLVPAPEPLFDRRQRDAVAALDKLDRATWRRSRALGALPWMKGRRNEDPHPSDFASARRSPRIRGGGLFLHPAKMHDWIDAEHDAQKVTTREELFLCWRNTVGSSTGSSLRTAASISCTSAMSVTCRRPAISVRCSSSGEFRHLVRALHKVLIVHYPGCPAGRGPRRWPAWITWSFFEPDPGAPLRPSSRIFWSRAATGR